MKWFKHQADAHRNLKTEAVLTEHGAEGYGLWWLCVELVASQGEDYCVGADKNWKRWLCRASGLSKERIDGLLEFFVEEKLIDGESLKEAQLYIPKLADHCDDYESRRKTTNTVRTKSKKVALEENRREENIEEATATPPTPVFVRKIREKEEEYRDLVKDLAAKDYLSPDKIHKIALEEFLPYWLERGENGKKARWEKEKVFDYQRRFRTWIKTFHTIQKDVKCTAADSWHRKGETCHHEKPETDYKNLPVSEMAKNLAKGMKAPSV